MSPQRAGSAARHLDQQEDSERAGGGLQDRDIYTSAFRHYLDLPDADDVDILAKVGFRLPMVPNRADRVNRLWDHDETWLLTHLGENDLPEEERFKRRSG